MTSPTQAALPRAVIRAPRPPRRLLALMTAGLVDSLVLSMAWTVVMLHVTSRYGLAGAGACSTAMLLGVALSAPFAGWLSAHTTGRGLLRTAGSVESMLRLTLFWLLFTQAPLWLLIPCVVVMNVVAWTGYAGMRAEVAAVSRGAVGLTWYGTVVAAVEAVGVALAALLPLSGRHPSAGLWGAMAAVYVLALVPTLVVAGGSQVGRAPTRPRVARRLGAMPALPSMPVLAGSGLMLASSAPPLLGVALADQLHGRTAVGLAAIAFTAGSLLSPVLAGRLQAGALNGPVTWVLLAAGIVSGWALAPVSVLWLCVAQMCSGLCMTSLEGLLDSYAAGRRPTEVTATLAGTTAGRALGSAAGSAVFPAAVLTLGLSATTATLGVTLVVIAVAVRTLRRTPEAGSRPPASWA